MTGARLLVALSCVLGACASRPDDSSEPRLGVAEIDPTTYAALVHPVMERRCGTLDCHGQLPRGLRVYGQTGLRLPSATGATPGVGPTTPEEARATYESIVGLQPEKTNTFVLASPRGAEEAYDLIVLSKPLAIERHRPGRSLAKGEPAERCIVSWLTGSVDRTACEAGAVPAVPPP